MPGAGPYEEWNVPFAPVRQPASGTKCTGCDQGAMASAARISTMPRPRYCGALRWEDRDVRPASILAGLFLVALTLRPQIVGIGPLLPEIQDDLDTTHAVVGLLATIPVLCMGLFAP